MGVGSFSSKSYSEYESKGDGNKILSTEEYLYEIRPYLKDTINDLKNSDSLLAMAFKFISSKDNNEERIMLFKNDDIDIVINDKAGEAIN